MELKKIVRDNIWKMKAYSSARDEFQGENELFLDANESPFGQFNRYPDAHQLDVKSAIAGIKEVKVDNIFIGNGSDEVIDLLMRIFCSPGRDHISVFSPTYGMYEVSAALNDVGVISIPLMNDFNIDVEKTLEILADKQIKILFLCSPNNPTGNILKSESIKSLLDAFEGIIVVDEAYIDFSNEPSWLNRVEDYHNLVVLQTFSKAFGLANARVGVAYANKDVIALLNKVKPPYNVSGLGQKVVLDALNDFKTIQEQIRLIISERERMFQALRVFSDVEKVYPSQANFLLVKVADATNLYNQLVKEGIVVRNRSSLLEGCLRITIGTPEQNDQLLNALKKRLK